MKPKGQFPEKLQSLFEPKRYKVYYGGRGGAKSWGCARALLIKGMEKPMRILCAREIQKTIKDSVHQLLRDQIQEMGLSGFYEVRNTEIVGTNGTTFGFEGLRHNIAGLKSWEGADICWVEEAQVVSKNSWQILIPTIRRENSEIWVTFNPELEEDETYQRFIVSPPRDSVIVNINYNDNPWFPEVLRMEMEELKERDYEAYLNVWEGRCKQAVEGAIFADEMQLAAQEGRIMHVPYDPSKPVDTFWDLGHSDQTAIWFAQMVGLEYRILRYYSNSQCKMQHYIKVVQDLPYAYGTHYLPHDASSEQLGQDKTIEQQAIAALGRVVVVPRVPKKANSIDAARQVFGRCYFDKELCADGIGCLRRYAYSIDLETGKISKEPEHNIWSHGADAFQCLAMAMQGERKPKHPKPRASIIRRSGIH